MSIYVNNPDNQQKLKIFEKLHIGHPIQTVNLCEIDLNYTCIDNEKM